MTTPVAGSTHQVVLSDGTTIVGLLTCDKSGAYDENLHSWAVALQSRTSLQTSTGEMKYSDLERPFFVTAQDDWKGGRGLESLAEDKTRFYDNRSVCTWVENQVILGPQINQRTIFSYDPYGSFGLTIDPITGVVSSSHPLVMIGVPPNYTIGPALGQGGYSISTNVYACAFTTLEACSAVDVSFAASVEQGTPAPPFTTTLTVEIYAESAGLPTGSALGSATITQTLVQSVPYQTYLVTINASLAANTRYYVAFTGNSANTQFNIMSTLTAENDVESIAVKSGGTWARTYSHSAGQRFNLHVLASTGQPVTKILPWYEDGPLYAVTNPDSGAGKVFRNGTYGTCDANTDVTKVVVPATPWIVNEWAGCTVVIHGPLGQREERLIVSNTTSALVVAAFSTAPTTSWTFGVLGSSKWTDVSPTSHTLTGGVTDVLAKGGYLWLCQDEAHNVLYYTYLGVGADAGFKARFMAKRNLGTDSTMYAAYYNNGNWSVGWCTYLAPTSGTMDFTVDYVNVFETVTGLAVYDDLLYIFTRSQVYSIDEQAKTLKLIDIDYSSLSDLNNGARAAKWNMFQFFPVAYGYERLYGKQVDDIGPNRGVGLPAGRQGHIVDAAATVDNLYGALDAGADTTAFSSVLVYNGLGWHELVRAEVAGQRIRAVCSEVVPLQQNRVWYAEGTTLKYVCLPAKTGNPYLDSASRYQLTGDLITPWMDQGLAVQDKFFHEIALLTENCSASVGIYVYYQTDTATDSSAWNYVGVITSSPYQVLSLTTGDTLKGKRIRFKFTLQTNAAATTPRLKAYALESVAKMSTKRAWAFDALLDPNQGLMDDTEETAVAATVIGQLLTWSGAVLPLTMTCVDPASTGAKVTIDGFSYLIKSVDEDKQASVFTLSLHLVET